MPTKLPTTIAEQLRAVTARFEAIGIESARLDSLILLEQVIAQDRSWLLAHPEVELSSVQRRKLEGFVARRVKREPLAYILGRVEFYGLMLEVDRHSLIPRPETEVLVELVSQNAPKKAQLLEIGTGSGAITLALASVRPDLQITATDVSAKALAVAKRNANTYRMHDIRFLSSNLMHDIKGRFDVIVANLPYVPAGRQLEPELDYEPAQALFGGPDGLDTYKRLFKQIPGHLESGGLVAIEAEPEQQPLLLELAAKQNLTLSAREGFALLFGQT